MDSQQFSTSRLSLSAGYTSPPILINDLLSTAMHLTPCPITPFTGRDIEITYQSLSSTGIPSLKTRRYEIWSPNSKQHPFYPGIDLREEKPAYVDDSQRRVDGRFGPFDATMAPQVYNHKTPWLAFVPRPLPSSSNSSLPEYEEVSKAGIWINNAQFAPFFLLSLYHRNTSLDCRMNELRATAEKIHIWNTRPVRPQDWEVKRLEGVTEWQHAVDGVGEVQVGMKHKAAWIRMCEATVANSAFSPSDGGGEKKGATPEANDNLMGAFVNDTPEKHITWFLHIGVPCFFIHEYRPGIDYPSVSIPTIKDTRRKDVHADFYQGSETEKFYTQHSHWARYLQEVRVEITPSKPEGPVLLCKTLENWVQPVLKKKRQKREENWKSNATRESAEMRVQKEAKEEAELRKIGVESRKWSASHVHMTQQGVKCAQRDSISPPPALGTEQMSKSSPVFTLRNALTSVTTAVPKPVAPVQAAVKAPTTPTPLRFGSQLTAKVQQLPTSPMHKPLPSFKKISSAVPPASGASRASLFGATQATTPIVSIATNFGTLSSAALPIPTSFGIPRASAFTQATTPTVPAPKLFGSFHTVQLPPVPKSVYKPPVYNPHYYDEDDDEDDDEDEDEEEYHGYTEIPDIDPDTEPSEGDEDKYDRFTRVVSNYIGFMRNSGVRGKIVLNDVFLHVQGQFVACVEQEEDEGELQWVASRKQKKRWYHNNNNNGKKNIVQTSEHVVATYSKPNAEATALIEKIKARAIADEDNRQAEHNRRFRDGPSSHLGIKSNSNSSSSSFQQQIRNVFTFLCPSSCGLQSSPDQRAYLELTNVPSLASMHRHLYEHYCNITAESETQIRTHAMYNRQQKTGYVMIRRTDLKLSGKIWPETRDIGVTHWGVVRQSVNVQKARKCWRFFINIPREDSVSEEEEEEVARVELQDATMEQIAHDQDEDEEEPQDENMEQTAGQEQDEGENGPESESESEQDLEPQPEILPKEDVNMTTEDSDLEQEDEDEEMVEPEDVAPPELVIIPDYGYIGRETWGYDSNEN